MLVSYYSQNRTKQADIATRLGFRGVVQAKSEWRVRDVPGRVGGQFTYRSFLFLSLAAAVADATRASSLLQFENGPLALAWCSRLIYIGSRGMHTRLCICILPICSSSNRGVG